MEPMSAEDIPFYNRQRPPMRTERREGVYNDGRGSSSPKASDLRGDWRAAERDTVAAKAAKQVAELALKAAAAAEEVATEAEEAAAIALEASKSAQREEGRL